MAYIVHGATGAQGSPVLSALTSAGRNAVAAVRHPEAVPAGIAARQVDLVSAESLVSAYEGADGVFVHLPLGAPEAAAAQARAVVEAVTRARPGRVVISASGQIVDQPGSPLQAPADSPIMTLIDGATGSGVPTAVVASRLYLENLLLPVILAVTQPNVLAVRTDLKVNSVGELVALAKSQPDKIDYASVGNGSLSHLAMELLKMKSGMSMLHIPFNGGPAAALALGRGDVKVLFAALSNVQPLLRDSKVRLLAVSNAKRSAVLPDLPTVAEQGYPEFDATTWNGFFVPASTPKTVVTQLNTAIEKILALPEVKQKLLVAGAEVAGGSPEQFATLIKNETAAWKRVIERVGIKPD